MSAIYDLQPAAQAVAGLLPGIADDLLTAPTPCPEYRVRDLLFHVLGLSVAFRDSARKDLGPTTSTAPTDTTADLPAQWRSEIPARLDELAAAWREPAAWEGTTQAGGVTLPAAVAGVRPALDETLALELVDKCLVTPVGWIIRRSPIFVIGARPACENGRAASAPRSGRSSGRGAGGVRSTAVSMICWARMIEVAAAITTVSGQAVGVPLPDRLFDRIGRHVPDATRPTARSGYLSRHIMPGQVSRGSTSWRSAVRRQRARKHCHVAAHPVRVVTATSLFDGHDAAINIMRRILQAQGAEVIHLGHNRSVDDVVEAVAEEDDVAVGGRSGDSQGGARMRNSGGIGSRRRLRGRAPRPAGMRRAAT